MRLFPLAFAAPAILALGACTAGGPFSRERPDEFAVARNAPLVVPPDFTLTPPRPGEADTGASDPRAQALQAIFGGPQARSQVENDALRQAGAADAALGARSNVADEQTRVVNRGQLVTDVVNAPAGAGREASVTTPQ